MVKNLPANAGDAKDVGSIPESGRSSGEGNGNPLQYSCPEIPWTEETDRSQSTVSQRGGHDLATKQCHHPAVLKFSQVLGNEEWQMYPGPKG